MNVFSQTGRVAAVVGMVVMLWSTIHVAEAQYQRKWLSAGSMHNWYSEVGNEHESSGFVGSQQDGWRWPGIYRFRDSQAMKGLWIGATNVTDDAGTNFPIRVVHAGPRVSGQGEFFPLQFEMVAKYDNPLVLVDGEISEPEANMVVDRVDPDIAPDRMLVTKVNTLMGITMERNIKQFSNTFHDNYHVIEYTFTNTGNVDADADIELPNQTLENVYFYWQWRLSVAKETRYVIGNGTGWGLNAMNDVRGDGLRADPPGEDFRARFTWHGKFPPFTLYDNIGGPILPQALPAIQIAPTDTLGRLGASQFVGILTAFAEGTPDSGVDDPAQPSTTNFPGSDDPYQSQNDAFNPGKMQTEYAVMTAGHAPRHAEVVEPSGLPGFLNPTGDPSLGTPGGISHGTGYGPYTLAPGESVSIIHVEASAGLSREANKAIGRAFYESGANPDAPITFTSGGQSHTMTKNEWVFTSRDSLFQTFQRAQANIDGGYNAPAAPHPPSQFIVNSGGDRIALEWTPALAGPDIDGYEIYRAQGAYDSTYTMIHRAGAAETSFDDVDPIRGVDYYYYIVAVNDGSANDGSALTPAGAPLVSSRYYTQTYTPARLKRMAGTNFDQVRIVPNPYVLSASNALPGAIRFPDRTDKLAFYDIPGQCRIEIFSELGELVDVIEHNDGSGDAFWDHTTSSRQVVASGVYIAVITVTNDIVDSTTGELIYAEGDRAFKKFVIIR